MKVKDSAFSKKQTLNCRGQLIDLSKPKVMGILNITPDSFFDGGRYQELSKALEHAGEMIENGADMIDVGGYSSRPGAEHISEEEELRRLKPVIASIRKKYPKIIISVDTFRSSIARRMVEDFEVDIINDISGGEMDPNMFSTIGKLGVPYVLMHIQGTPQDMQNNPVYENIMLEIMNFFSTKVHQLYSEGCYDVILDPGFGFGKTLDHNYQLIQRFDEFGMMELPLLVGISRKSMIYKPLEKEPEDVLYSTVALHTLLLQKGADIFRVHDVGAAVECLKVASLGL